MNFGKATMKKFLEESRQEYLALGGWKSFKDGTWFLPLVRRSFEAYWYNANAAYFRAKYPRLGTDQISARLISVAARNASILGGLTGVAVSADEVVAFLTGAEAGFGLPANIAVAAAAIGGETLLLLRFQLQLVANLGKLYGVELDPDDPEDVLTILAFALGGSVADAAGTMGMKVGGKAAGHAAKQIFSNEWLAAIQKVGLKIGIKILQREIVKYTVPIVSLFIGSGWNYLSTRAVGRIAVRHFKQRRADKRQNSTLDPKATAEALEHGML